MINSFINIASQIYFILILSEDLDVGKLPLVGVKMLITYLQFVSFCWILTIQLFN